MAYLTGRIRPGEPTTAEALGVVFLCTGIALWLGASFLLAAMVAGMVVANLARHHQRPFRAIKGIEWPFMILFFFLAGSALELTALASIGFVGGAYVLLRVLGRLVGSWVGGGIAAADRATRNWMGMALLPQAGVALGMALVASEHFPQYRDVILPVVIGSTVFFEFLGPVMTRVSLRHAG
jgi:Kef-type K+ transport system membrane component KefB